MRRGHRRRAQVLIADIRDQEAEAVTQAIRSAGGIAGWIHCDLADESSVAAAFARARGDYGRVDVLADVAGIIDVGAIHAIELAARTGLSRLT